MPDELPISADQPLPGLGEPGTERRGTELETQVRRSLRYMADHGLVDERHAGLMQLALELARVVRPNERAYGIAQAAAQLLATFDKLMPSDEGGAPDGIAEIRAYLAGVDASRSGT